MGALTVNLNNGSPTITVSVGNNNAPFVAAAVNAATAAQASQVAAAASATSATTQATNAAGSATAAAGSASGSSASATTATTQASNASTSATAAAGSATAAAGSSTTAATAATAASGSATNAATSATGAASSATTATTQASNASTSATAASGSASTATTQASNASTSATNAASSATAAAASAAAVASGTILGTVAYTANRTLALSDVGLIVEMGGASAQNVTFPLHATVALPLNTEIPIRWNGTGSVTLVATGGVTLLKKANQTLVLNGLGSLVYAKQTAFDVWEIYGDLALTTATLTDLSSIAFAANQFAAKNSTDGALTAHTVTDFLLALLAAVDADTVRNLLELDLSHRWYVKNDGNSAVNGDDFTFTATGTSTSFGSLAIFGNNAAGILQLVLGTTTTGALSIACSLFTEILFGLGVTRFKARAKIKTLSTGTDTYVARIGFIDSVTVESTDGVFFRYTDSVNGGKWQAVTRSNSVETATDTGITAQIPNWNLFYIVVNAAGTSAAFYIDGTLVATNTTNIPTGASRDTGYGISVQRSAGTTSFTALYYDYQWADLVFTTPR